MTDKQDCEHFVEELSALLDAELSAEDEKLVQEHLAGCAACSAELEELRKATAAVRALPAVPAPAELRQDVLAAVAADREKRDGVSMVRRYWPVAAAILIAAGFYLLEPGKEARPPAASSATLYAYSPPATETKKSLNQDELALYNNRATGMVDDERRMGKSIADNKTADGSVYRFAATPSVTQPTSGAADLPLWTEVPEISTAGGESWPAREKVVFGLRPQSPLLPRADTAAVAMGGFADKTETKSGPAAKEGKPQDEPAPGTRDVFIDTNDLVLAAANVRMYAVNNSLKTFSGKMSDALVSDTKKTLDKGAAEFNYSGVPSQMPVIIVQMDNQQLLDMVQTLANRGLIGPKRAINTGAVQQESNDKYVRVRGGTSLQVLNNESAQAKGSLRSQLQSAPSMLTNVYLTEYKEAASTETQRQEAK